MSEPSKKLHELHKRLCEVLNESNCTSAEIGTAIAYTVQALVADSDGCWSAEGYACAIITVLAKDGGISPMELLARVTPTLLAVEADKGDERAKATLEQLTRNPSPSHHPIKPRRTVHVGHRHSRRRT